MSKHILYATAPAADQVAAAMAIIAELLARGHRVSIASASPFKARFEHIKAVLSKNDAARLAFVDLGNNKDIADYTEPIRAIQDTFRIPPGGHTSFLPAYQAAVAPSQEELETGVLKLKEIINDLKPDIVLVDTFYSIGMDAVRAANAKWILVLTSGPGMIAQPNPLIEPLPLLGMEITGPRSLLLNLTLGIKLLYQALTSEPAKVHRDFRANKLGLPKLGLLADSMPVPPLDRIDSLKAALVLQPPGMHLFKRTKAFDRKCFFVGGTIATGALAGGAESNTDSIEEEQLAFLHAAEEVIYVDLGNVFTYTITDYKAMLKTLEYLHRQRPQTRFLWRVEPRAGAEPADAFTQEVPEYVHRTKSIPNPAAVLQHPAVKVVVNDAGSRSVNAAILAGVPQLVIPQWTDCLELGQTVVKYNLGVRAHRAPELYTHDIASELLALLEPTRYESVRASVKEWALRSHWGGGPRACADIVELAVAN